ncbi:sulfotransferase [Oceaniserpentilla sp. 4NH20-0058]|uniref:sulfotransferase n=1 Tax=Oceaniserpentilla sp. 4NH20-0058 TaxID=3127660 RepID=UPI00310BCC95
MKVVFIGGVGGSGTRVVANIFKENNIFIGSNLNKSLDNLDWPGLRDIIKSKNLSHKQKLDKLSGPFTQFIEKMRVEACQLDMLDDDLLAIKVPGSFYYLPYFCEIFEDVSYIHVIRHGLDMAFSGNKNQLLNWSDFFGVDIQKGTLETQQLDYWIAANEYAIETGKKLLGTNFQVIQFENLCLNSKNVINRLFQKLNLDNKLDQSVYNSIVTPVTKGRYEKMDLSIFSRAALSRLKDLGFNF